jgi:hypothetical protein
MEGNMNIFLSWSGDRSKQIAEVLKKWLPYFVQAVKPWMSSSDIDKGTRWSTDIASKLAECTIGIICLTPENIEAPWIMFEAGALSKTLDKTHVCPLLFEMEPSDLKGPLVQFQTTKLIEEDFKKLIHTINKCLEDKISEAQIEESFNAWWPKVELELKNLSQPKKESLPKRKDREILEEILEIVRQQARKPSIQESVGNDSSKIRVANLADRLGLSTSEIIDRLRKIGVDVKTPVSFVDESDVEKILSPIQVRVPALIRRRPKL